MTATLRHIDFVDSIAAALQYISYYHPADYIAHLAKAYEIEQGPAARDAIAQILTNSKMCAEGHRPICQDTGIVNVFLKIGMDVRFEGFPAGVEDAVNDGVRKGYLDPDNTLRASIVGDPHFDAGRKALEAHVHADLGEHVDDAGVLADRPVPGRAHTAVGQDLRDRVLRRCALLALVGTGEVGDVVGGVVVADVLQRGGD